MENFQFLSNINYVDKLLFMAETPHFMGRVFCLFLNGSIFPQLLHTEGSQRETPL